MDVINAHRQILSLARQAFDYDDWRVIISTEGVSLQPSGEQMSCIHFPRQRMYDFNTGKTYFNNPVQDAIDSLRSEILLKFVTSIPFGSLDYLPRSSTDQDDTTNGPVLI